ncbi:glycosyl hydrolase [Acidobacteria bacterium ACD]|nr:MAG: glycosyl hydrolase [Acidobacteriota bacterium]MCE7957127.1 glycosyl hydrolase [Acidobacteria bacterium ACB2]MDL1948889.1 glycosyl hydrolase [Acidobacteria bacterium ACD]
MRRIVPSLVALLASAVLVAAPAKEAKKGEKAETKEAKKEPFSADTFAGLSFRGLGPAFMSGRIGDLAVDEAHPGTYYVAVASGGVWKTTNWGTTFEPVFDEEGSYSIGCVALDPRNPLTVWVGTGENNSQRSVGYGDGVYRSLDGGKSWENMGLKASEHVGKILVDPRDSKVVWVAAQGPLWKPGGDRGLFKSTDGGKSWKASLTISENTGVSDLWMDPRDPDVLYATAYQRRRHVWTLIDGGPESGIHKTTDGGATWKKLEKGLPKGDVGRIGLAVSPADPDTVYAIVEAARKAGGVYRSTDAGGTWEKRDDYVSQSPQYYNELVPDPKRAERVYSMDTWLHVTEDGGKSWKKVGEKTKHVDNHAMWIEPSNTDHVLVGCDGGIYESWDRGATWDYKANLPVTQFYRVAVDESKPFYLVYGGTQDNNTHGGPSRTTSASGILNSDWFTTTGGDGFVTRVDPTDPDVLYSESQHGVLVRFDRKTGEEILIQPQAAPGEAPLKWNWDSPLVISPHSHTRLYFAAQRLFVSDDRGDSWTAVSPDLTRQVDRNKLKVMGRVWGPDTVAKNASTSFYGNIVSLSESPKQEGLLYVGTDDGLVQVSEDGGKAWRKQETFPGVPDMSYVSDLEASLHDAGVVYAAFDNHKMGDFKPYLLRSADRGKSWASIAGDLPERGTVYSVAEDHANPSLLFAGTEFGVYFTNDGGKKWVRLKGGIPTIAVRDIQVQRRESDLVLATFGRGFYVLDDYSPLRTATPALLEKEAELFAVKPAWMFIPRQPLGGRGKATQGDSLYMAENPPFGAVFTYYLKDDLKTRAKAREEAEKEKFKKGEDVFYPSWEELTAEAREEEPALVLTVTDEAGEVVRRVTAPGKKGFARVAWDLRYPPVIPTSLKKDEDRDPWDPEPAGPLAMPGTYRVSMAKRVDGKLTPLGEPQAFTAQVLGTASLPPADRKDLLAFQQKTARLHRAVLGARRSLKEAQDRVAHLKKALDDTPKADPALFDDVRALGKKAADLDLALNGDKVRERYNEPAPSSISDRVQWIVYGHWTATSAPTKTFRNEYDHAAAAFADFLPKLTDLVEKDLAALEAKAEKAGAPWTPGRVPRWTKE